MFYASNVNCYDIQGKRCLEIGCIIREECRRQGYAAEGMPAFINYGFELFGVSSIYAAIRPENTAAIAVAERFGMTLAGEYSKKYDGKPIKHLLYAISSMKNDESRP